MAEIYPFSSVTVARLRAMPGPGNTHRWLAQVASGLSGFLPAEKCFEFLRRCCDELVSHRPVPDREIEAAVDFAYASEGAGVNFGRGALKWPGADAGAIEKVLNEVEPVFEGEQSTGMKPSDVLPSLFSPGELVCTGADSQRAVVRPIDAVLADAERLQFIVVNPMKGLSGLTRQGKPSARCQSNVGVRRHIVAEFDDASLTKRMQAQLASALGQLAPFVMAVYSGGKSVHAWYRVDGMSVRDQARFFAVACVLGADPTRWDVCGWLRMPGGLRVVDPSTGSGQAGCRYVRQRILYWSDDNG